MTGFALGYGTNGFSNHRLDDALDVLADLGYGAVALTIDHEHLDPFADNLGVRVDRLAARLDRLGLRCVVETGARYLLDPRHKHHPTLVSDEQSVRVDFLHRAIAIADGLGADCMSFWSGVCPPTVAPTTAWQRLSRGVETVLDEARRREVTVGLEPEPGMVVETLADALRLRTELGNPAPFGITLDVGHCVAVEPDDAATCIRRAGHSLVNVQLDDMVRGVHEHLEFGQGELDLAGTLAALDEIGYRGSACVELPRHSHAAPDVAARAMRALRAARRSGTATSDDWTTEAERRVRADPAAVRLLFPAAGRQVGRRPCDPADRDGLVHGTVDDLVRVRLLTALADTTPPDRLAVTLTELYRGGDDAERRGVLRWLNAAGPAQPGEVIAAGVAIVLDALRANDIRLVAAAVGAFAGAHLDAHHWRQGVLKCLFVGVPLAAVAELAARTDIELIRMIADFAAERGAAGRPVPADAEQLLRAAALPIKES